MESYFSYSGRLNRQKYFIALLVAFLVYMIIGSVVIAIYLDSSYYGDNELAIRISLGILHLAILSPAIVRRFHDIDKPGSYFWFCCIPIVNLGFGLVLLFQKGTEGENKYGPDLLLSLGSKITPGTRNSFKGTARQGTLAPRREFESIVEPDLSRNPQASSLEEEIKRQKILDKDIHHCTVALSYMPIDAIDIARGRLLDSLDQGVDESVKIRNQLKERILIVYRRLRVGEHVFEKGFNPSQNRLLGGFVCTRAAKECAVQKEKYDQEMKKYDHDFEKWTEERKHEISLAINESKPVLPSRPESLETLDVRFAEENPMEYLVDYYARYSFPVLECDLAAISDDHIEAVSLAVN